MRKADILERQNRAFKYALDRIVHNCREDAVKDVIAQEGSFKYVPYLPSCLIPMFEKFKRTILRGKKRGKFLDAGCGVGSVVLCAYVTELAHQCHGIDIEQKYIDLAAKTLVGSFAMDKELFKADILTFKDYAKYDILYYFCPFTNDYLEKLFEEYIEDEAKVGAYIFTLNKHSYAYRSDPRFKCLRKTNDGLPVIKKIAGGPRIVSGLNKFQVKYMADHSEGKLYPHIKELLNTVKHWE